MKTIGILGLGYMGSIHAKNLVEMGHETVIYDPKFGKQDSHEILKTDGLIIASPIMCHTPQIHWALGYNLPVFVEKPIMHAIDDGVAHAIRAGSVMVGNNGRYHPCLKIAKGHIPKLGKIKRAVFAISQHKDEPRPDIFLNWGAHEVDFALYLLGPAVLKHSVKGAEGAIGTLLLQQNGHDTTVYLDYIGAQDTRYFVIEGENGNIWADLDRFIIKIRDDDGMELSSLNGSWDDTYKEEMREFIRRIDGEKPDGIGATGDEGLACLEILLEAQKKAEK